MAAAGIAEEPGSDEDYDANESYEEDGDYLTDDSIDPDEMTYEVGSSYPPEVEPA